MTSPTIITWNATNWITVALMALVGFVAIRLLLDGFSRFGNRSDD